MTNWNKSTPEGEAGFSLVEVLVSVLLASIVIGSMLAFLSQNNAIHHDRDIMVDTKEQARVIADMIAYDLRALGAGIPFNQENFLITDAALGDAPYPILTTSTATQLELRSNDYGRTQFVNQDYNPATTLSIRAASTVGITAGDTIYLSNAPCNGKDGLKATVRSVDSTYVYINSGYITTSGATFCNGATIDRVNKIRYVSPADDSGIWRDVNDNNGGSLLRRSTFRVQYLNRAGAALALPLTASNIANELSSILLTVQVRSQLPLKNGNIQVDTVVQHVFLRNLVYSRL